MEPAEDLVEAPANPQGTKTGGPNEVEQKIMVMRPRGKLDGPLSTSEKTEKSKRSKVTFL